MKWIFYFVSPFFFFSSLSTLSLLTAWRVPTPYCSSFSTAAGNPAELAIHLRSLRGSLSRRRSRLVASARLLRDLVREHELHPAAPRACSPRSNRDYIVAKLACGGPTLPDDLVFCEILTRLQAKPLLRCHAVCRSWRRRVTSDAEFLRAHHRRQPSFPLVTTVDASTEERRIDALDHRTGERRPVARTTGGTGDRIHVFASCGGLLILLANGGLEICNPATRQRAPLAPLDGAACISALYPHRPSGSYRVLCFFKTSEGGHAVYHVHTVGSGEIRCVGEPPGPWASGDVVEAMPMLGSLYPPVLADGRIYWPPVKLPAGGNGKGNNMLVFDTMAESFQHLLSPVEGGAGSLELFQISNGGLGLYDTRAVVTADIWVLQDHKSWTWSLNSRIKLPDYPLSVMPVLDPEGGDVLVLSATGESSFEHQYLHAVSGADGSLLARYEWSDYLILRRHMFRESLVRHDFFSIEGNAAGSVDEKPLFDGLSTVVLVRDDN